MDRKVYYKRLALVDNKIDYIIQERQIVAKALGKQIDIEDPGYTKFAGTSFQSIVWMLIFDIVTIKRTVSAHKHETNRCITTTKLLRSCI